MELCPSQKPGNLFLKSSQVSYKKSVCDWSQNYYPSHLIAAHSHRLVVEMKPEGLTILQIMQKKLEDPELVPKYDITKTCAADIPFRK